MHASRSAYAAMVRQHSPDGTVPGFIQALQAAPEGPVGEAYRCGGQHGGQGGSSWPLQRKQGLSQ